MRSFDEVNKEKTVEAVKVICQALEDNRVETGPALAAMWTIIRQKEQEGFPLRVLIDGKGGSE
jgi:hypothetical protein